MPKKSPKHDDVKNERILNAAVHEFATLGFHDAKTDVIAREAGVSKGLVFHYYENKANLYLAAARHVFEKLNAIADFSVWRDAPDLKSMIARSMRYKIALQVQYPDEFALGMALIGGEQLPSALKIAIQQLFKDEMAMVGVDLVTPLLKRQRLREGVSLETVRTMMTMMSSMVSDKARPFLEAHPDAQVADLEWLVDECMGYIDVLEHGFLA